jgi:hypothetical protein
VGPEGADRGPGSACAKDADESTNRDAGTSATARNRNAGESSNAGRRPDARPNVARTPASKPSTPRRRGNAVAAPRPRPKPLRTRNLRPRVVTQQNFFSLPLCDRPGCYEPPVRSPRNLARYCCAGCRQAVSNVRDRERKWLARGTLDGRKKRAYEYQAARQRRSHPPDDISAPAPARSPPK